MSDHGRPLEFGFLPIPYATAHTELLHQVQRAEELSVRSGAVRAAVGTIVAATAGWIPLALVGIIGAGLGTAVCAPTLLGLAGRGVGDDRRGAAVGTVTTLAYLDFVIAPAFVGLLAQATSLRVALASTAAAAAILAVGSHRAQAVTP